MAFYNEMAVMALDMIKEFGQPVTISRVEPGQYDPVTGGEAPGATLEQTAQGILLEYSGEELQRNSLIKQGDKKLKIAAQGLAWVPGLLDKIAVQGRTWSIIPPLKEINPAGTPILYELQVRS